LPSPKSSLSPLGLRRAELAARWLKGSGIEIGALHQPLQVPADASVTYIDRKTVAEARVHYPELANCELVEPDIIDDGEHLASIPDGSQDFVIANHFIEHCEDPIAALGNALRVLRSGGILYLAAPDKRRTFDQKRPLTTLEHLDRDHREGPGWSRVSHYREWARLVNDSKNVDEEARHLQAIDYSIHFHVWTSDSFRAFLEHGERSWPAFELVEFVEHDIEFVAILRKQGNPAVRGDRR
jgi:SAM-dependent methyltransferase